MTIAQNFASKLSVALVAAAMILSVAAPAQAQSSDDMQKMINDLLAQVAALQSQLGGTTTTTTTTTTSCDVPMAPLTMGAQGGGVTALQNALIAAGESIPAGATGYFGAQTRTALASWQTKNNISPAAGYYGPVTMAAMKAACVPADDADDEGDMDEDDSSDMDLSGEASLDLFEMEDGTEDEAEEGESDVPVGELTVEFVDGDASISRIDVTIAGFGDANGSDAYDVFETISLWVDGDMVAEIDAADEDEYLDEDDGSIRFNGLDIVAMEDEELDIVVAVSVQNNVDTDDIGDWRITPDAVRYFDADGVATTESGDLVEGDAEFEVVVEGDDESLDVSLSSDSPDSANIAVDSDSDTNDVTIMAMTLEAENNDVELSDLVVRVQTTGESVTDVVDEVMLVLDGQTFKAKAITTTGDLAAAVAAGRSFATSTTAGTVQYYFDIDGDVMIDEDSEIEAEVVVDFNDTNDGANYATGQQIFASVETAELAVWDVEGADTFTPDGSAIGETHTLVDEGLTFDVTSIEAKRVAGTGNTPVDTAEFEVTVEVSAIGDTFYIEDNAGTAFDYTLLRNGTATTTVTVSPTLGGSGVPKNGNRYRIDEGQTETFTFMVTVLPGGDAGARYRVQFDDVDFFTASTGGSAITQTFIPAEDFRTNEVTIVN
jgi:Putative peptidoglycan binding domain